MVTSLKRFVTVLSAIKKKSTKIMKRREVDDPENSAYIKNKKFT